MVFRASHLLLVDQQESPGKQRHFGWEEPYSRPARSFMGDAEERCREAIAKMERNERIILTLEGLREPEIEVGKMIYSSGGK